MTLLIPNHIHMHARYAGFFRLQVTNRAGIITKDTGWFKNLITNQGLDMFGTGNSGLVDVRQYVSVGTGDTPPAVTDTTLGGFIAVVGGSFGQGTKSYVAGPPAYWAIRNSLQFPIGTATGILAEIGTSPGGGSNPAVFSRSLIVDGSGNPTTITVLSDEALTVTYELRQYLDLTDHAYSFSLSGTPYSGTYRRAGVTTPPDIFRGFGPQTNGTIGTNIVLYNGTIGSVNSVPGGTSSDIGFDFGTSAYAPGSYYLNYTRYISINQGNIGGINSFMIGNTGGPMGRWQCSVTPTIPKTSTYAMQMNWSFSWARYTP